ncbi:hypothetical protein AB9P05_10760 [Roseivirga sp. BDSF3-8]|uniref:hypothetical protein n=1 Tax=Roseivirga sp. BDSF3-8 TaxID=3241598 RepID=UPI003531F143
MKKKLNLGSLDVTSFVTKDLQSKTKGGTIRYTDNCGSSFPDPCLHYITACCEETDDTVC